MSDDHERARLLAAGTLAVELAKSFIGVVEKLMELRALSAVHADLFVAAAEACFAKYRAVRAEEN